MKKWKKISSEVDYDSKYFKVRRDKVELPDGKQIDWTYWDSPDSAMVLGMTKENKLIMIKQYRYMVGDFVIEFPAGYNDKSQTMEEAAKREFEEETGYTCGKLEKLGAFYETYGQLNRKIHLFFARNARKMEQRNISDNEADFDEYIETVLVDFDEAVQMALENKIVAMGSALAILLLKEKLGK